MMKGNQKFNETEKIKTSVEITLSDDLADSLVNPPIDQKTCEIIGADTNTISDEVEVNMIEENSSIPLHSSVDCLTEINDKSELCKDDKSLSMHKEMMPSNTISDNDSIHQNIEDDSADDHLKWNQEEFEGVISQIHAKTEVIKTCNDTPEYKEHENPKYCREEELPGSAKKPLNLKHEKQDVNVENNTIEDNKVSNKSESVRYHSDKTSGDGVIDNNMIVPEEEETKIKKKRSKKVEKNVIVKQCDEAGKKPEQESVSVEVKRKSYSAAIKLNLSKEFDNNLTVSSPPIPVPNSSPLKPTISCSPTTNQSEQDLVVGYETSSSVSTPDIWEQTCRRRKHKGNNKKRNSPYQEKIEAAIINTDQSESVCDVVIQPQNENIENTKTEIDEIKTKKIKSRRRRSKTSRKDSESSITHHRIMICDDQVMDDFHIDSCKSSTFIFRLISKIQGQKNMHHRSY